ncbi:ECF transporter S component [Jeotgalicoccus halotolerans]|uniref:Energy-coupling factor transport system substrate-specific component n=1 Tax=Jeotgalicoccus halotolerans TaxID=157227 RepID=A0A3E0AYW6_9STAP|nr:ECF transporter S component [Jeotgalicoccus halotolerans]REG24887.1 energy-coupling factor transport system substrate-specific component [Jeotgalicoccus halotolerans]
MAQRNGLTLTDILITVVIALVFAVIYSLWDGIYTILQPFGLHLNELVYGMWFIAAIVAYLVIRKPGVALIAEFAAASGETIVLLQFDISLIMYGLIQGLACELIFMFFRYKSTSLMVAVLAGIAAALSTLPLDWYYGYLGMLETWNLVLMFSFRILSGALVAGWLGHLLYKALKETGVLKFVGQRHGNSHEGL